LKDDGPIKNSRENVTSQHNGIRDELESGEDTSDSTTEVEEEGEEAETTSALALEVRNDLRHSAGDTERNH